MPLHLKMNWLLAGLNLNVGFFYHKVHQGFFILLVNIKHKVHKAISTIDFIKYKPDKFLKLVGFFISCFLIDSYFF